MAAEAECTVVIACDGSESANFAFEWYVSHFHKPGNKVILCHVPEGFANVTMMSPGKVQEMIRETETRVKTLKEQYSQRMKQLNVKGEFLRVDGEKPGPAIVKTAKSQAATFIVTGTRGQGKIRRTIMGSVSDYVVHHSPIPVLVCRMKGAVPESE